jgi:hypothetical protein
MDGKRWTCGPYGTRAHVALRTEETAVELPIRPLSPPDAGMRKMGTDLEKGDTGRKVQRIAMRKSRSRRQGERKALLI